MVIEAKDMMESSGFNFKAGKLRRCLSIELHKSREKKMKLKDYMYLNSISGVRKKVSLDKKSSKIVSDSLPFVRIREFANETLLENKIKG